MSGGEGRPKGWPFLFGNPSRLRWFSPRIYPDGRYAVVVLISVQDLGLLWRMSTLPSWVHTLAFPS